MKKCITIVILQACYLGTDVSVRTTTLFPPHYLHVTNPIPLSTIYNRICLTTSERSFSPSLLAWASTESRSIVFSAWHLSFPQFPLVRQWQWCIFTSHFWWEFPILSTACHPSRLPGCSSEPESSAGPPQHNPPSRQPCCCLIHCSFAKKTKKLPPKCNLWEWFWVKLKI